MWWQPQEVQTGWDLILEQYRAAATPQDKVRYLLALPATPDPALLARTLDLALSDEVRTQDAPFLVAGVMSNRAGGSLAWQWVEDHWEQLQQRLPPSLVARIFEGVPALVDGDVAGAVHAFAEQPRPPARRPAGRPAAGAHGHQCGPGPAPLRLHPRRPGA